MLKVEWSVLKAWELQNKINCLLQFAWWNETSLVEQLYFCKNLPSLTATLAGCIDVKVESYAITSNNCLETYQLETCVLLYFISNQKRISKTWFPFSCDLWCKIWDYVCYILLVSWIKGLTLEAHECM